MHAEYCLMHYHLFSCVSRQQCNLLQSWCVQKQLKVCFASEIKSHLKAILGDTVWRQCRASIVDETMQLLA